MGLLYAQFDCDLPRDPKMLRAGPLARLLYMQCVLYGRENLTDGKIEAVLLPLIATDIPKPHALMAKLADAGLVEVTDYGWRIPPHVWAKRNPTRVQVETKREADRVRKDSKRNPGGQTTESGRTNAQEETETEEEPEEEPEPSAEISDDDDSENTPDGLSSSDLATALATYLERSARHNTTPARWIQGTARNILGERLPELDQCIADGLTQRQAVLRLMGRAEPTSQPDGRWHAHPHCLDCDGSGWMSVGNNTFDACKCRQDRPHELPLATVHTLREATA